MAGQGGVIQLSTDLGADGFGKQSLKLMNDRRKIAKPVYPLYIRKVTSKDYLYESMNMGGFQELPLRDEGGVLNYARPDVGNKFRMQTNIRQLAFAMTKESQIWRRDNQWQYCIRAMEEAARRTMERIAATPFNLGFNGTLRPLSDGQPLFSASHTRLNGQVVGNLAVTNVALTQQTLETALISFRRLPDESGNILDMSPKILMVSPENMPNAMRAIKSLTYTTNALGSSAETGIPNDYIRSFNLAIVENPYLTNTLAWFLLGSKEENGVFVFENMPMDDYSFKEQSTQSLVYSVEFAQEAAAETEYGLYGSPGV